MLKYRELEKLFGEFGTDAINEHLTVYRPPFSLIYRANDKKYYPIDVFKVNRAIYRPLTNALTEIKKWYGEKFLVKNMLNVFGGCFNQRKTADGKWWSVHSVACAIDLNPDLGQQGVSSMMPFDFVQIFKENGFQWGGEWVHGQRDGMHFTYVDEGETRS